MAGDSVIGALRVVLGLDTASFEEGTRTATGQVQSFAKQIEAVFAGTGLERIVERVFDAIIDKFKEGIVHALEFADQMGKTAQKVGLSVEELSSLRVAAELSDVSMETLSKSLGILSKNMLDTVKGTGNARETFKDLGISVTDGAGQMKSATQVLGEIADKFSGATDGAVKTADALKLLGRGGKDLIPLLNEGKGSLEEWTKAAGNLGLVISQQAANESQKFNDDLKVLKLAQEGVANTLTAMLLPALVKISGGLADAAKNGTLVKDTAESLFGVIKTLVTFFLQAVEANSILGLALDALQKTFVTLGTTVTQFLADIISGLLQFELAVFNSLTNPMKVAQDLVTGNTTEIGKAIQNLQDQMSKERFGDVAKNWETVKTAIGDLGPAMDAATKKVDELFQHMETHGSTAKKALDIGETPLSKELDKLQLQALIVGQNFAGLPTGFAQLAVQLKLTADNGSQLATTFDGLTKQQQQLAIGLATMQAAQTAFDNLTPFDKYNLAMQQLILQLERGKLSQEDFALASEKAALRFQKGYLDAFATVSGAIGDSVQAFAGDSKKLVGIAQIAHAAQALIATYAASAEALATGVFPANLAAAAVVLAKGLALVAAIKTTAFATGGSFKVGGSGGVDSQMVTMALTPGEMVDVKRPGQGGGATPAGGGTTEVVLRGVRGSDLFTGQMVADLVTALNTAHSDGYKLKVA